MQYYLFHSAYKSASHFRDSNNNIIMRFCCTPKPCFFWLIQKKNYQELCASSVVGNIWKKCSVIKDTGINSPIVVTTSLAVNKWITWPSRLRNHTDHMTIHIMWPKRYTWYAHINIRISRPCFQSMLIPNYSKTCLQWTLQYTKESVPTWQVSLHYRFLNKGKDRTRGSEKMSPDQRAANVIGVSLKHRFYCI